MTSSSPSEGVLLRARGLRVDVQGRMLIAPSDIELREGERVLLVGPSGSGKSLFTDLIFGFAGPATPGLRVEGSLTFQGDELLGASPEFMDMQLGAVFQLHALGLFDDLTVDQNLRFGSDDPEERSALASSLGLDHLERKVHECSGGERMRIAICRTLLRGAQVLVYDEPTTGLDPAAVKSVLGAFQDSHRRLSLAISHDYEAFRGAVDVILVLDPRDRVLRRFDANPESWARVEEIMEVREPALEAPPKRASLAARAAHRWRKASLALADAGADLGSLAALPIGLARMAHPLDGPRFRHVLRRDVRLGVVMFTGTCALMVALTGTYFLFEHLPKRKYTGPLVQDDLLAGLGMVFTRIAMPMMVSVLLAAKLGAAAAAHIGHMSLTRQVDALRLMRIPLRRHLLQPTALGQILASWLTTVTSIAAAGFMSMLVYLVLHPGFSVRFFAANFTRELEAGHFVWIAVKVGLCALAVAAIAFRIGIRPKRNSKQVIEGIHKTLLWALVAVVFIHAVIAFFEF